MNALLNLLDLASVWIVFLPVLVGMVLYRQLKQDSRYVLLLSIFACAPQLLHALQVSPEVKAIAYNSYTIIEFVLWWAFFRNKFAGKYKVMFQVSTVFYVLVTAVLFYLFHERFINEAVCMNNLLFTMWILLLVLQYFVEDRIDTAFRNSLFWYLAVLLLYSVCSFLVFSFWNYRQNGYPIINHLRTLHSVFNVLLYLGFCSGFIADFKKAFLINHY